MGRILNIAGPCAPDSHDLLSEAARTPAMLKVPLSFCRFALLALATLGFAAEAQADVVVPSQIWQQNYCNGSAVGDKVGPTFDSYSRSLNPLTPVGYTWSKTEVVKVEFDEELGIIPTKYTTIGTYESVPYAVSTYQNAHTYENCYFTGNHIDVSYNGNGATGGSTALSSFTYDIAGAVAENGFTREFAVTYNANGGSVNPSSEKATSAFANWANTASGSASYTYSSGQTVTNPVGSTGGTVTLYARWNDASVTLPTPTRAGHSFSGWYTEQTGGMRVGGAGDSYGPVSANKMLYAQWTENSYTISFKKGKYGSGTEQSLAKIHGTALTLPGEIFTRGGYTQKGWSYDVNGTTKDYSLNGSYTKDEATTLYPYWEARQYTVTIMPGYDGGNIVTKNYSTGTGNQTINISVPSRSGWTFSSWQADFSSVEGTKPTVNMNSILIPANTYGDFTITAQWAGMSYNITVSANGGTGGSQVPYQTSKDVQTVGFTNPTRGGYTIGGWTVGSGYTGNPPTVADQQVTVPANTYGAFTITPTWNGVTYSATVQPGEGGTGGGATQYTVSSSQWQWDFPAVSRTGYHIASWTYSGWNKSKPSISDTTLTIPGDAYGDITATPTWAANAADITYENYNQYGALHPTSMTYDEIVKVSKPTKSGNSFAGWQVTVGLNPATAKYSVDSGNSWQDLSSDEMKVGADCETLYLKNLTAVQNGSVTLYANWGSQYTIAVLVEPEAGGTITGGGVYAGGDTAELVATPNDGYSFERWTDDATAEAVRTVEVTSNATYTACFTGNVYRVQFDAMEGGISGVGKFYVQFGNTYGASRNLPVPTPPEGQRFSGWYTEEEGGSLIANDTTVSIVGNHTLYARYEEIVYPHHFVRFDGNGATSGEMAVEEFVGAETKALTANAYGKVDYTFAGWATNSVDAAACRIAYTNCQSVSFPSAQANETNDLYAAWRVNQYPLSLQLGKGIGAIYYSVTNSAWISTTTSAVVRIDCGAAWKAYAMANAGYTYNETSQGSPVSGKMSATGALFAPAATPRPIAVTYNGNAATGGETAASNFEYDTPDNLTSNGYVRIYAVGFFTNNNDSIPAFATSNSVWSFVGWNSQNDGLGPYSYADGALVTNLCGSTGGDVTLFAQWTSNVVSAVVVIPPAPVCEGYEFLGWGSQKQSGELPPVPCWLPGQTYVANWDRALRFYAYWREIPKGNLSLQLGTGIGKICYRIGDETWNETMSSISLTLDTDVPWSAYALAKSGYTTNSSCSATGIMTKTGATFAPSATANTISVSYNGNGSTGGTMDQTDFTYDQTGTLPANGYVRSYPVTFDAAGGSVTNASGAAVDPFVTNGVYAFAGWATNLVDAAACRVAYTDGQTVKNLSTGDPVTLYAVWTTNEASVVTLPGAVREDYELLGWSQVGSGRVLFVGEAIVPTNATRFVAQWRVVLGELSDAVGLTNAVLKAVADEVSQVTWMKKSSTATKTYHWDYGHTDYVRLVNQADEEVQLDAEKSPLKLFVKLTGPGTFTYELYWGSGPEITMLDICGVETNVRATVSSDTKWAAQTNTLTAGQHELVWLVSGNLKTSDKIAVDNMIWMPDEPSPSPIIVKPGVEVIYDTEEAAKEAAKNATWTRPNAAVEAVVSEADYRAMFDPVKAVPSKKVSGKWTLTADLTPSVSNAVQTAVNAAAGDLVSQFAAAGVLSVDVPMRAGLYYGLVASDAVAWLKSVAPTNWTLGTGNGGQTLSVDRPSVEAGFFKVLARPEPPEQ